MGKNKNKSQKKVAVAPVNPVAPEVEVKEPVTVKPATEDKKPPVVKPAPKKPVQDPPTESVINISRKIAGENLVKTSPGIPLHEINLATQNILTRYSTHPVEGMDEHLKELYVGKAGLVDVLIATSMAIILQNNQTAIIKNLPKAYVKTMLESLGTIGVTIKDQKQLELQFKEKDNSISIQPKDVEIEEGLAAQIEEDKKNEEEANAVEIKDNDESTLKARLIKVMVKTRDEKKPLGGIADALEELQLQDILGASTEDEKVKVRNRTMTEKLNRLFSIIPFNTLLIATGRMLISELEKSHNPILVFTLLKNSIEMKDSKGIVTTPFTDQELATIIRIFVEKSIDLFDSTTNEKIKFLQGKEKLNEAEKQNLTRLEASVARNREISCILTNFSKGEIAQIGNHTTSIKQDADLKTDEEKEANKSLVYNTQLYYMIAKALKLDSKKPEDENLATIHNYGVYVANLFREVNDKLIPTGKISIVANTEEIDPKDDKPAEEPAKPSEEAKPAASKK